jgi:nucleotide-binding universal stress UspA family protein
MVQEIVVGLDGSRMAEAVIEPAAALARILQWPMTLVQVVLPLAVAADPLLPFPVGYDEQITEVRRREALDYLEDVAEGLRGEGIAAAATAVVGEPARTLLDLGRRSGVSSWRLGPAAAGGGRRFMLGSVADKLVRGAAVQVLVVPASRRPY